MFYTIRSRGRRIKSDFQFPTCKKFYNIFHPLDPVVYRLEPLIDEDMQRVNPYLIEHHAGMRTVYKIQKITSDISKGIVNLQSDITKGIESFHSDFSKGIESIQNVFNTVTRPSLWFSTIKSSCDGNKNLTPNQNASVGPPARLRCDIKVSPELMMANIPLNEGNRVDYMLQETPWETANPYVAALSAHSSYFDNIDVARY
jgi:phospholipase DDHD2